MTMKTEKCIICGESTRQHDDSAYCSFSCAHADLAQSMAAFKKEYSSQLGSELFGSEWDEPSSFEGCVMKEDYAYGDIAAENCANL